MAARAFWVIVSGDAPTAFRSRNRDDLVPTLKQLQRTQPDATLQWFDRGKLWPSQEASRDALEAERRLARDRGREWRPGGSHKDPRARFQIPRDEKRRRFKNRLRRRQDGEGDWHGKEAAGNRPKGERATPPRPLNWKPAPPREPRTPPKLDWQPPPSRAAGVPPPPLNWKPPRRDGKRPPPSAHDRRADGSRQNRSGRPFDAKGKGPRQSSGSFRPPRRNGSPRKKPR